MSKKIGGCLFGFPLKTSKTGCHPKMTFAGIPLGAFQVATEVARFLEEIDQPETQKPDTHDGKKFASTLWCILPGCQDFNFWPTSGVSIQPLKVKLLAVCLV